MNKEIDLIQYLPLFVAEYKEIQQITKAENPEFNLLAAEKEKIQNNQYIISCDESGIARFEQLLNIIPVKDDTFDERKMRILTKFNQTAPYTLRSLGNMLKNICGENGYILELIADEYTIKVQIALKVKKQAEIVGEMLERILPCNMLYTVELLFNTWQLVKNYAWGALNAHSWRYVKEEVLP